MLTPQALYLLVLPWLQGLDIASRPAALTGLTQLIVALLTAQSVRPSALMRALLSPAAGPARQRYKRVARAWDRPWLASGGLTPLLVRAALVLVPPERQGVRAGLHQVALDSGRCGPWAVCTLG